WNLYNLKSTMSCSKIRHWSDLTNFLSVKSDQNHLPIPRIRGISSTNPNGPEHIFLIFRSEMKIYDYLLVRSIIPSVISEVPIRKVNKSYFGPGTGPTITEEKTRVMKTFLSHLI